MSVCGLSAGVFVSVGMCACVRFHPELQGVLNKMTKKGFLWWDQIGKTDLLVIVSHILCQVI